MPTGTLVPTPYQTVLDANGNPVSGAQIGTYVAGTTTPVATYSDVALTIPNTNPIITDSAARYVAYLSPGASYKFVVQDASGASIRTVDNISAVPASSVNLDITGVAGETFTAGQVVYLSDGSGGKVAGSWYKADSSQTYSSMTPQVGMVPAAIASGASGSIRLSGEVTGLSGLVVGTTYFVGTAGATTSTAPANARVLGVADTTASLVLTSNPPVATVYTENVVFPAVQVAAAGVNTLDDYEEGTWTPVLGGSGGTSGQTYSSQTGHYVKIGKLVHATFTVVLTAKGTITTDVQIQGLPFTIETGTTPTVSIGFWSLATTWVFIGGLGNGNTATATLWGATAASALSTKLAASDISNATQLLGTLTFRASA